MNTPNAQTDDPTKRNLTITSEIWPAIETAAERAGAPLHEFCATLMESGLDMWEATETPENNNELREGKVPESPGCSHDVPFGVQCVECEKLDATTTV